MTELLTSEWVYVALFAFALLDGFFPPVPSETAVLALAATWASDGNPAVVSVVLVAVAGAFTGDQLAYLLGRRLTVRPPRRRLTRRLLASSSSALFHHGDLFLVAARFVPGGRVAVTVAAGAIGYPRLRYALCTAAGAVLWACYYAVIGATAGSWLADDPLLAVVVGVVGSVALTWVVGRVVGWVRARRPSEPCDSSEHHSPSENRSPSESRDDRPVAGGRLTEGTS